MQTLRFGLVGFGHFGRHYARLLQNMPGVELVTIANTSVEMFAVNGKDLPDHIKKTTNTQEIFNDATIDCVVIAAPPSTHKDLIAAAIEAGKHVLVEKPMVTSMVEAKAVEKVMKKKKNKVFMVGFQYIYNDHVRYLKEHLGDLGEVKYVLGEHLYCGPFRSDIGSFMDAGIHDCAILEYLFSPGKITKVIGASSSLKKSKKDDFTAVTVTFQSGLAAHILTSWYWPEKVRKVTLVGDKGMALFNDRDETKLKWIKNSYPEWDRKKSSMFLHGMIEQPAVVPVSAQEPLLNELKHFIECVNTDSKPLTNIEFGSKVTRMMEEISGRLSKL